MKIDYSILILEAELLRLKLNFEPQKQKISNTLIDILKDQIKDLEEGIRQLQLKRLKNAFDD